MYKIENVAKYNCAGAGEKKKKLLTSDLRKLLVYLGVALHCALCKCVVQSLSRGSSLRYQCFQSNSRKKMAISLLALSTESVTFFNVKVYIMCCTRLPTWHVDVTYVGV